MEEREGEGGERERGGGGERERMCGCEKNKEREEMIFEFLIHALTC